MLKARTFRPPDQAGSAHWNEAALSLPRVQQADPVAAAETIAAWIEDPAALLL